MTSALLSRLARSRITRGLSVVLALGFPLNAPLLGQTTSPDSISIVSGLVCEGGSETFFARDLDARVAGDVVQCENGTNRAGKDR